MKIKSQIIFRNPINHPSVGFLRKSIIDLNGGYRHFPFYEDYDLWMRISERYIIAHVPKSLTKVRVTGDNSSFIVNQNVWQKNWARVIEKMQQRANG